MKRTILLFLALTLVASPAMAADWSIDKAHTSVGFSVKHMVISKTTGAFGDFDGTIVFDGNDPATGSVEFVIQTASIDTDDEKRDEHLRSAEFLETEQFPIMTFMSKKISALDGNEFEIVGYLTIKGVKKEVTLAAEFNGIAQDPWGNTRSGFSAVTKIDRQDFGVSWSKSLDAGGLVVGNEVEIALELELIQTK